MTKNSKTCKQLQHVSCNNKHICIKNKKNKKYECFTAAQFVTPLGGTPLIFPLTISNKPNIFTLFNQVRCQSPAGAWVNSNNRSLVVPQDCSGCYSIELSLSLELQAIPGTTAYPNQIFVSLCEVRNINGTNVLVNINDSPGALMDVSQTVTGVTDRITFSFSGIVCLRAGQYIAPCITGNFLDGITSSLITTNIFYMTLKLVRLGDCV